MGVEPGVEMVVGGNSPDFGGEGMYFGELVGSLGGWDTGGCCGGAAADSGADAAERDESGCSIVVFGVSKGRFGKKRAFVAARKAQARAVRASIAKLSHWISSTTGQFLLAEVEELLAMRDGG